MKNLLRQLFFLACVGAGTFVLAVYVVDNLLMPFLVDVPKVRVPELRGLSMAQAQKRLEKVDLRLALRDSFYQETVPAGAIIDQIPQPRTGKQIKKGRRVFVDLSRGPRFYTVPDVRQVSLRDARLQLEANQLAIGRVIYVSSRDIPEGAVIDQVPRPGTRQSRDSRVDLRISSGSPSAPKRVPDLNGLPIEVVEDTLRKYEMRLGRIENQVRDGLPAGTVLSQKPGPAAQTARATAINLVVSVRETLATVLDTLLETAPENLPED